MTSLHALEPPLSWLPLHAAVIAVLVALAVLPGLALLRAVPGTAVLPAASRPAAALVLSLGIMALPLAAGLAVQAPAATRLGMHAATWLVVLAAARVLTRRRRAAMQEAAAAIGAGRGAAARRWLRGLPSAGQAAAASVLVSVSAYIAWLVGTAMRSDALIHAAMATKLEQLDAPGFSSLSYHRDGSIDTNYFLPPWHEALAQASIVTNAGVPTVIFLAPTLLVPVAVLTWAGLGRVAFGSPAAGWACGAAWLVALAMNGAPRFRLLGDIAYPGELVIGIVLPLFLTAWLLAVGGPEQGRRSMRWLMVACLLVIAVLHGNYLAYTTFAVAGAWLAWRLAGEPSADRNRAMRGSLGAVAGATAAGAMYVVALQVATPRGRLGREVDDTVAAKTIETWAGVISPGRWGFQLEPSAVLVNGGLAVLALTAIAIAAWRLRGPAAELMVGVTAVTLALAQSSLAVSLAVAIGTSSVAGRSPRTLLLSLGIALFVLLLAHAFDWISRRRSWPGMLLLAGAAAVGLGVLGSALPYGQRMASAGVLLAALLVTMVAGMAWRWRAARRGMVVGLRMESLGSASTPAIALAMVVFVLGTAPLSVPAVSHARAEQGTWKEHFGPWALRAPSDGQIDATGRVVLVDGCRHGELGRVPQQATVVSRPHTYLFVAAQLPVYVVVDRTLKEPAMQDGTLEHVMRAHGLGAAVVRRGGFEPRQMVELQRSAAFDQLRCRGITRAAVLPPRGS